METIPKSYRRRPGTVSQHGADFQYQVTALLLARALSMAEDVRVASDAEFAGDFDDVVLSARLAGRPLLLTMQLKHKKGDSPSVSARALTAARGDFSVRKYFGSFLRMEHEQLGGRAEDAYYVLFTNASVPEHRAGPAEHAPPPLLRLLSAGCAPGDVLRLSDGYLAGCVRGPEFLARLLVCRNQADGDLLTELIRQELALHLGRSPPDLRSRADALVRAVQDWWQRDGDAHWLTADWPGWRAALADAGPQPPPTLAFGGMLWQAAEVERLSAAAAAAPPGSALLVPAHAESLEARVSLCLQAAAQRRSMQVALASCGAERERERDTCLALWARGWGRELALVLPSAAGRGEGDGVGQELVRRLLSCLEGSERVLLLLAGPDIHLGRPAGAAELVRLISSELQPRGLWGCLDPSVSLAQLRKQAARRDKENAQFRSRLRTNSGSGGAGRLGEEAHSASPGRRAQKVLADRTPSLPPNNRQRAAGSSPLLAAVRRKDLPRFESLLLPVGSQPPDLLATDGQGDTALHLTARAWGVPALRLLLKAAGLEGQLATLLAARNRQGEQAVHAAAARADTAVIRALADAGADLTAPGAGGASPLQVACRSRKYKQVCLLTELCPAALLNPDSAGNTPLHIALSLANDSEDDARLPPGDACSDALPWRLVVIYGSQSAVGTWRRGNETLSEAFSRPSNRAQLARTLLAACPKGALAATNVLGDTPLHSAARGRRVEADGAVRVAAWGRGLIQQLLLSGADPAALNGAGDSPADIAARAGAEDIALLLQAGGCGLRQCRGS